MITREQIGELKPILLKNFTTAAGFKRLVVLPDDILAISNKSEIEIWDLKSNQFLKTLTNFHGDRKTYINSLKSFNNNLATGSKSETLRIWNLNQHYPVYDFNSDNERSKVTDIADCGDNWLASISSRQSRIDFIKPENEHQQFQIDMRLSGTSYTPEGMVSIAALPNQRIISSHLWQTTNAQIKCELNIWDIISRQKLKTKWHNGFVSQLCVSQDGFLAAVIERENNENAEIKIWDINSEAWDLVVSIKTDAEKINSLIWASNSMLIAADDNNTVMFCDKNDARNNKTLHCSANVTSLALLSNQQLVSVDLDGLIQVWDISNCVPELFKAKIHPFINYMEQTVAALERAHITQPPYASTTPSSSSATSSLKPMQSLQLALQPSSSQLRIQPSLVAQSTPLNKLVAASTIVSQLRSTPANVHSQAQSVDWSQSWQINYSDISLSNYLGEGTYGIVYKAFWQGKEVAVKKLHITNPSDNTRDDLINEAKIMSQLHSPHLVRFYGCSLTRPNYCIVMEYMANKTLAELLLNNRIELSWDKRYKMMSEITYGVTFLHERHIVHRDIKSLNILLNERGEAKLSDFGFAKVKTEGRTLSTQQVTQPSNRPGTLAWMAPELFDMTAVRTEKSDIYALGMVLWEIAARRIPYANAEGSRELMINHITQGKAEVIPSDCPPDVSAIIKSCWQKDPTKRPSAREILSLFKPKPQTIPVLLNNFASDPMRLSGGKP